MNILFMWFFSCGIPCPKHSIFSDVIICFQASRRCPIYRYKEGLRCISNVWPCSTYIKNERTGPHNERTGKNERTGTGKNERTGPHKDRGKL